MLSGLLLGLLTSTAVAQQANAGLTKLPAALFPYRLRNTPPIFYGGTPWPFVTLKPNSQYVIHPGKSNAYANDIVIGLKTTVNF